MKTAISVPDVVFQAAEKAARELRISRSRLYAEAVAFYIDAYRKRNITDGLNRIYSKESSKADPVLSKLQSRVMKRSEW